MLTDRDCNSVEMIPSIRLRDGTHYIVFDDPEDTTLTISRSCGDRRERSASSFALRLAWAHCAIFPFN
jgi:hypothetical protein